MELEVWADHLIDEAAEVDHRDARNHILADNHACDKGLHDAAQVGAHQAARRTQCPAVHI